MREPLLKLLHTTPMLKLLLPLVGGIVFAKSIAIPLWPLILMAFLTLVIAFILTYQKSMYNAGWYLSMCLFFFMLGASIYKLRNTAASEFYRLSPSKYFIGIVTSIAEPVPYGQRYEMKIIRYRDSIVSWKPCNANILLYAKKQAGLSASPGQYVLLKNVSLQLQHKAPFPYSKSQSEFYFQQNISGLIYLDQSDKIDVLPYQRKNLLNWIQQIRERLLKQASIYFPSTSERAIFQSLFFGYRSEMESKLTQAYATAGVIHILSVSGLHVGIIYVFFLFLTSPFKQHNLLRIFRTLLIISAIWFYGLLAGFSPPVVRSCSMFTILGLAQLLQRETFSFNTLSLSAFITLLFAPHQLFNIGFQLSYAAMAGIFLFYQPFSQSIKTKTFVGKRVAELIAVSLAAQLGTLPFTLYYFNSFPLYFLLANLIIVPLATLIMYTGI
ncbi:MAG: ComEC/Rec2 family competence protein, partial [Bacteroidales bacterium]